MKVINIMNFVRELDPRIENSRELLFNTTKQELDLVNEFGYENTFLLQYDALIDRRYQELFKEQAKQNTELGLWLEIAEPLTSACNLPWRGRPGWLWDSHVVPGFSMAYTPEQRESIIDECMRAFHLVFGYYPKTVASWLLDSHTANYLYDKYHISTLAICRDQTNTDAYTLVGGYFNGAYYPSRNNIFTPAQTREYQLPVPVFRLLGPDPVHNYDNDKYLYGDDSIYYRAGEEYQGCYTMEPAWPCGQNPRIIDWFLHEFYCNEDMGFSYSQIGQENSFAEVDFLPSLRMCFEKLREHSDINILKMADAGECFRRLFPNGTPATSVCALNDWNRPEDIQSIYYDCASYTANLFREKNRIFIRSLYLFDERVPESYLYTPCQTWDATYENLPIVDTLSCNEHNGLCLTTNGSGLSIRRNDTSLCVKWDQSSIIFSPERIQIDTGIISLDEHFIKAPWHLDKGRIIFAYKGTPYALITNANIIYKDGKLLFDSKSSSIVFEFQRGSY